MPIPGKGRTLMRFNHFIAIPVVQRWPSGPEVQQPVLTNRWFYSCPCSTQAGKRPGGWEMMSKTGWDNFKCLAVPSLLYWNVLRTTQYGCFFFWEALAHMTPRLFPRDIIDFIAQSHFWPPSASSWPAFPIPAPTQDLSPATSTRVCTPDHW